DVPVGGALRFLLAAGAVGVRVGVALHGGRQVQGEGVCLGRAVVGRDRRLVLLVVVERGQLAVQVDAVGVVVVVCAAAGGGFGGCVHGGGGLLVDGGLLVVRCAVDGERREGAKSVGRPAAALVVAQVDVDGADVVALEVGPQVLDDLRGEVVELVGVDLQHGRGGGVVRSAWNGFGERG